MSFEVDITYNGVSVTDAYVTINQVREEQSTMMVVLGYYTNATQYTNKAPFRTERVIRGLPVDYTSGTDGDGKNHRKQAYEWLLANEAEFSTATEV